ncbi:MAG: ABC transporter ATP-binding protein [Pseudolabrys sp.]|nr:ABC transporter ATP-binding protein [Pseudolabrys sp.]
MSDIAISIEGLSKRYMIGRHSAEGQRYMTVREEAGRSARDVIRKTGDFIRGRPILDGDSVDEFWALKDVTFDVKQGEAVAIIGRNGAGKSTLLKILSRITEPTKGCVRLRGRVASLLEIGTGFHPELTGRENIYLNGAILGMSRAEIRRNFDAIVAFADVDEFLDTPVKRYSSGMSVRLAFSIAAHLTPEILIVDEVLAVGDAEFQQRCLGKLNSIAKDGRTVLFVSHSMGAVSDLTSSCALLDRGRLTAIGPTREIVQRYLCAVVPFAAASQEDVGIYRVRPAGDAPVRIATVRVIGTDLPLALGDKTFSIGIDLDVVKPIAGAHVTLTLWNANRQCVTTATSWDADQPLALRGGRQRVVARFSDLPLAPGDYFVDIGIDQSMAVTLDAVANVPLLKVVNLGAVTHWPQRPWGAVHSDAVTWSVTSDALV